MNTFAGTVFAVQHGEVSDWEREAVAFLYAPEEKENISKPATTTTETPEAKKQESRLLAGFFLLLILGGAFYGNG